MTYHKEEAWDYASNRVSGLSDKEVLSLVRRYGNVDYDDVDGFEVFPPIAECRNWAVEYIKDKALEGEWI